MSPTSPPPRTADDDRSRDGIGSGSPTASRRAFLAACGAAAVGATAGCLTVAPQARPEFLDAPSDASATLPTRPDTLFRSTVERTGYWPDETVPEEVELAWTEPDVNRDEHTAAKGSPLYYEGSVIVPADTGDVYSYSPEGERNWSASLVPSSRGTHATPAIVENYVFTAGYDGAVYAFDAGTGETIWRTKVSDAIGSSPVYYDGVVYCATEFYAPSGGMVALDAATGGIIWEDNRVTNHAHSQTGLDPAAGYFAAGSNDGRLYVWTLDREFHGTFETGAPIKGPVCMHEGRAIFGSWDESVYAVDLDSLTADWEYETGWRVMSGAALHPDTGTAIIGSHDGYLHAIDLATGDREWLFDAGSLVVGSPTVVGDTVLTGSYADAVFAVDAASGEERWRFGRPHGWVTATPAVHDGDVYVLERASFDEEVLQRPGALYKLRPA